MHEDPDNLSKLLETLDVKPDDITASRVIRQRRNTTTLCVERHGAAATLKNRVTPVPCLFLAEPVHAAECLLHLGCASFCSWCAAADRFRRGLFLDVCISECLLLNMVYLHVWLSLWLLSYHSKVYTLFCMCFVCRPPLVARGAPPETTFNSLLQNLLRRTNNQRFSF